MIDQTYQAEINKNLDDQQRRPSQNPAPPLPLFQNFLGGTGGAVAGPLQFGAGWADVLKGYGDVTAAGGASSGGGMFSLPSDQERQQSDAARDKLMTQGLDLNSATGATLRTRAKAFMPDPQATGKAGVILGGLTDFASQAIPAAAAGPAGLVALATGRGVQKAQDLQEQGVDVNTRTAAGIASGTVDAASMLLPMTGPTRLIAAGKGAVGGAVTGVAQTAAERLILEHGGYDRIASTYDPFDPVSIALSSVVPGVFGALHAPAGAAKPAGGARAEPTHADVTLSPAEQAHSDAVEASTIDTDIASLQRELAGQRDEGAKAVLQTELARLQKQKAGGPARLDPDTEAAARVTQAAESLDRSRLTADDDLPGYERHTKAVETASDQLARGAPVEISHLIRGTPEASPEERTAALTSEFSQALAQGRPDEAAPSRPLFDALTSIVNGRSSADELVATTRWAVDNGRADIADAAAYRLESAAQEEATRILSESRSGPLRRLLVDSQRERIKAARTAADTAHAIAGEIRARPQPSHVSAVADAVEQYRASVFDGNAEQLEAKAQVFEQARAQTDLGTAERPATSASGDRMKAKTPEGAPEHPGPGDDHLEAATAEILRTNPDLMVQLEGMEHPMLASELLAQVRAEADADIRDSQLFIAAAQCAITL